MPSNGYKQKILLAKLSALESTNIDTSQEEKTIHYWRTGLDNCISTHSQTVAYYERMLTQAKEILESKANYYKLGLERAEKALEEKKNPQENPKQREILLQLEDLRKEAFNIRSKSASATKTDLRDNEKDYILQGIYYSTGESYDDWYNRVYGKKPSVLERALKEEQEEAEAARLKQLQEEWKKKDLETPKEKKVRKAKS